MRLQLGEHGHSGLCHTPHNSDTDTVTTHTQQVDWSRQGESDCLIKQGILRLLSSVQCSAIRANLWSDVMEWIHDEYSVIEKHAQTMLQLVKFGIDWKCGELEQIVNIPVTQIVEEIADREYSSYTDCGRDRRS